MTKIRMVLLSLIAGLSLLASGCGAGADSPAQFQSDFERSIEAAKKGKELMKGARKKPLNIPKRPVEEPG